MEKEQEEWIVVDAMHPDHSEDNREPEPQPQPEPEPVSLLEEVEQAMPEEGSGAKNMSLGKLLGGEVLGGAWMRRQVRLIALILMLTVLYITNRYSAEQELIEIEDCRKELQDIKYRTLTRSSELTLNTRQSVIEHALRQAGDTTLLASKEPPFVILESDGRAE